MKQGEVYWYKDNKNTKTAVVILSSDYINESSNNISVAPLLYKKSIGNPMVVKVDAPIEGYVYIARLNSILKTGLGECTGAISPDDIRNLQEAIMIYYGCKDQMEIDKYYKFKLGEELEFIEDKDTEFKEIQEDDFINAICNYVERYSVAFLNECGGSIYFGIDDQRRVKGLKISKNEIDELKLGINSRLKYIIPKVPLSFFDMNFHNVYDDNGDIDGLYVVELNVRKPSDSEEFYLTRGNKLIIRADGELQTLVGVEMISYIKEKLKS